MVGVYSIFLRGRGFGGSAVLGTVFAPCGESAEEGTFPYMSSRC